MACQPVRRRLAVSVGLAALAIVSPVAQGQPVVSFERATELTKTYPFTRFSRLASFDVPLPVDLAPHGVRPQLPNQPLAIPPEVTALNGTTLAVRGYMLPIDAKPDGVSQFILTPTIDSCHWGMLGMANEWVLVEMGEGKRVPYVRFQPVVMFGRLRVEPQWRGSALTGLYTMRGDYILTEGS